MFRSAFSLFSLVLSTCFVSCDHKSETGFLDNKVNTISTMVDTTSKSTFDLENEITSSPNIIRTKVPKDFYGYQPDTLQVSQYIRRIFQDSKGNMWLGTVGDGVCRYDGQTLTYYSTLDGFSGNSVQDIAEDKNGNIWFATSGGVSKFNGKEFIHFTKKNGASFNQASSLFIDKNETIWVGTTEGVYRYDGIKFTAFESHQFAGKEVRNITEDNNGNIWFATINDGVFYYTGKNLINISEKDGLGKNNVRCILQYTNGKLYFATRGGGLSFYDPLEEIRKGKRQMFTYADEKGSNEVERLFEDKNANLWVAVRGGVRCYTRSTLASGGRSFTIFSTAEGLTDCCIQSIYQDKAGNIWFGGSSGLFRLTGSKILNVTKKGPWPKEF